MFVYVSVPVWVCAHRCRCLKRPKAFDPPGAGIRGSCETKLNPLQEQKTLVTSELSLPQESAFCCRYETSQCLCFLGLFLIEEEEVS